VLRPAVRVHLTVLLAAAGAVAAGAQEAVWLADHAVRTWAGYRDNPQLSSVAPQPTPLLGAAADVSFLRLTEGGGQTTLAASGEATEFLARSLDGEQLGLVQAAHVQEGGGGWRLGLAGDYLFQNQVFDVSVTETDLAAVSATGHTLIARPEAGRRLGEAWRLDAGFELTRQFFSAPLDDEWETTPRLDLEWSPHRRQAVTLSGRLRRRQYDTRAALDAAGAPLARGLVLESPELELEWRRDWDERRRWRTRLQAQLGRTRDNGGGYFDFLRCGGRAILRYEDERWSLRGEVRAFRFEYPIQTSAGPGTADRVRTDVSATLRAGHRLGGGWEIFAEGSVDHAMDNVPASSYRARSLVAGLEFVF
jgi:hypothetical protein